MDGFVAVHALKFHAREGDDLFAADIGGEVDGISQLGDDLIAEFGIARPFGEAVAADEGNVEAECPHLGIVFAVDALHADKADVLAVLGQNHRVHGFKTPTHDGVLDAMVFNDVGRISGGFGNGLCAEAGSCGGSKG